MLDQAASLLRDGRLVALPTETVYGLGANALDKAAVESIFRAKQRPAWDPVIVHISDLAMLDGLVRSIPPAARALMEAFWPGPLTLLLERTAQIPDVVTAGRPLVGVRMPAHPVALELIRRAGVPVAAPSANRFGHTSPTTAGHVLADLDGRIDAVVDAGESRHGVESTVADANQLPVVVYRPGAVTCEQIAVVAGSATHFQPSGPLQATPREALPSPGVGLRHYAPAARLVLVDVASDPAQALATAARRYAGERLGVLLPQDVALALDGALLYPWGRWADAASLAHDLYSGLRALDAGGCSVILCPRPSADGLGAALLDRLLKAATPEEA